MPSQPKKVPSKPVSISQVESTHLVLPPDTNILGTIFGGRVMEWIDVTAAIAAFRHCRRVALTIGMDELNFFSPIHLGDIVILKSSVNYVHNTSMEVGVKIEAEDPRTGERRHTSSAYLTFVSVDEKGKPMKVPNLLCETEEEKRRFEAGRKRREERLQKKQGPRVTRKK